MKRIDTKGVYLRSRLQRSRKSIVIDLQRISEGAVLDVGDIEQLDGDLDLLGDTLGHQLDWLYSDLPGVPHRDILWEGTRCWQIPLHRPARMLPASTGHLHVVDLDPVLAAILGAGSL